MSDTSGEPTMRIAERLNQRIHRGDPFADVDAGEMAFDLQGWFEFPEVADVLIGNLKPDLIIEVGSWKGASTVPMAKTMRRYRDDCAILCVDTWLGSAEHWMKTEWHGLLQCRSGYPGLYRQFLVNMVHEGLQDVVVPLPLPSYQAAIVLTRIGLWAPLIYVDGGHDYVSVSQDLESYWPCLMPGGVLFGDDYGPAWPGLVKAVGEFVEERGDEISASKIIGNKFILHKR